MKPSEFFKKYATDAVIAANGTAIFPSVMLAQAALESGWGESGLTKKANALFGIKSAGQKSPYWDGGVYTSGTVEYQDGQRVSVTSGFRAYSSVGQSLKDYVYFLQHEKRYANHGVFSAQTPEDQVKALKAAGYATDPNYASKLISIISQYGLKQYDLKKKS